MGRKYSHNLYTPRGMNKWKEEFTQMKERARRKIHYLNTIWRVININERSRSKINTFSIVVEMKFVAIYMVKFNGSIRENKFNPESRGHICLSLYTAEQNWALLSSINPSKPIRGKTTRGRKFNAIILWAYLTKKSTMLLLMLLRLHISRLIRC